MYRGVLFGFDLLLCQLESSSQVLKAYDANNACHLQGQAV